MQCRRTRKLDPGREKVADDMREKVLDMRLRPNVDEGRRQKSDHADDERRKKSEAVASTDGPAVSARGSEASGDDCMGGSMALILSVSCSSISSLAESLTNLELVDQFQFFDGIDLPSSGKVRVQHYRGG